MAKPVTSKTRGDEYVEFGKNLATARNALGLTQAETARQLGLVQSTYGGYETGTRKVPLSMIIKLAVFFQVTPDMLIGSKPLTVVQNEFSLTQSEKILIKKYRLLNRVGKQKLSERTDELMKLGYLSKEEASKEEASKKEV